MQSHPPRVLFAELGAARAAPPRVVARPVWWEPREPDLARVAPWAGGGLVAALMLAHARRGAREPAFAIAVGDGVRRGVPTAARASVGARAPLTERFSEGLVGGSLGPRLASVADAVLLTGRAPAGSVLVIESDGEARLEPGAELAGLDPARTHARLLERFGPAATLRIGPAGERGAAVASLASGDEAASFVGRGGLGAAFAALGLKALVVHAPETAAEPDSELARALASSPRLKARAEAGTFELGPARAARGELDREAGEMLYRGALAARRERTGCRGCPTPCGWSFALSAEPGAANSQERALPARFGKVWSLGPPLGLARFEDALELAAACDEVGADAKEVGAALAVLADARGAKGDLARLRAWVLELGRGAGGDGALLARGASALARELGREAPARAGEARGPEGGAAALLGAWVSTNGADPMRTFPFLLEAGGRARMSALLAGVPLPAGSADPSDAAGKGRIVWWHENLVAGLDLAGFCAFSAAGLLADGVLTLDALAERLLPAPLARAARHGAGRTLLDAGAEIVGLRRELAKLWPGVRREPTAAERELLHAPGMLPEYERWRSRGWSAAEEAASALDEPAALARHAPDPIEARTRAGAVVVRAAGPLARRIGPEVKVDLAQAQPLAAFFAELERVLGMPLARAGVPLASVYRDGRRLDAEDDVRPGDALDLVLAIAGG